MICDEFVGYEHDIDYVASSVFQYVWLTISDPLSLVDTDFGGTGGGGGGFRPSTATDNNVFKSTLDLNSPDDFLIRGGGDPWNVDGLVGRAGGGRGGGM